MFPLCEVAFPLGFWYRDMGKMLAGLTRTGSDEEKGYNFSVMVKLLMQWDIKAGREQDFSEFVVREFAPKLTQLGVQPSEVLYTMYGTGPQMLAIGVIDSAEKAISILNSANWKKLHSKLLSYVTNYSHKVVRDNGRDFQM